MSLLLSMQERPGPATAKPAAAGPPPLPYRCSQERIKPLWEQVGRDCVFVTPGKFSWSKKDHCWTVKEGKNKRCFRALLRILRRTFFPHSKFSAIRRERKLQQDKQALLGFDNHLGSIIPTTLFPGQIVQAVSIASEQSGLQAGREVDDQIRCVVNLFDNDHISFKYDVYRFSAKSEYLTAIRAFHVHMPDNVYMQLNPIVRFWLHEMCRLRWRGLQSQGGVYHDGLRIATAFDVIALDQKNGSIILIENKNSKQNYFTVGAMPMRPPLEDKLDSAFNQAQIQAKFTAWLVESTYDITIERIYVVRTQLGQFETMLVEDWVHERFPEMVEAVAAELAFVRDVRTMDTTGPDETSGGGRSRGDDDDAASAVSLDGLDLARVMDVRRRWDMDHEGEEADDDDDDDDANYADGGAAADEGVFAPSHGHRGGGRRRSGRGRVSRGGRGGAASSSSSAALGPIRVHGNALGITIDMTGPSHFFASERSQGRGGGGGGRGNRGGGRGRHT